MIALLLAVAVAAVWLGCVGFIRLGDAFDRLHCVAFVGIAAGVPVMLAGFVSQGADRVDGEGLFPDRLHGGERSGAGPRNRARAAL